MRRVLFLFVLAFFISGWVKAQQPTTPTQSSGQSANCTQVLRLARAVYEQGRLHELENLLDGCLKGTVGETGGFATVQEQVDAYRLLCLSYIYLEEPAKADQAMLGLLNADHFFVLNPTDPAEFQALYRTFRTEPVFAYGVKLGGGTNFLSLMKAYNVGSESIGNTKYGVGFSFCAGAFIEKEFFPNFPEKNFLRNTLLRADAYYSLRNSTITNNNLWTFATDNERESGIFTGKLASSWIDFNILLKYRYNRKSSWDPYIGIGPGISFLVNSKINQAKLERKTRLVNADGTTEKITASNSYSGPSVEIKSAYKSLPQSVSLVWGVNKRFGAFYINMEGRFQYGLGNLISKENRTIPDLIDYSMTINDHRQSNLIVNLGVTLPKFTPKKLTKKK
jgi:hypothetical protein